VPAVILKRLDSLITDTFEVRGVGDAPARQPHRVPLPWAGDDRAAGGPHAESAPSDRVVKSFHLTDNMVDGVVCETVARPTAVTADDFTLTACRGGSRRLTGRSPT
jgi:hypothetical protein